MDIKDTEEMMVLGLQLGMVGKQAMDDGDLTAADLGLVLQLLPYVGPAFDGMKNIPAELQDMDSDEAGRLMAKASEFMPRITDNAHKARIVMKSIKVALAIGELVIEIRNKPEVVGATLPKTGEVETKDESPVVTSDGSDQANNG